MRMEIRKFQKSDLPEMIRIWNEVVEDGEAFPQEEFLNLETGKKFFSESLFKILKKALEKNIMKKKQQRGNVNA